MYKNRYQWTMGDMEKAGLNPILAAGSGMVGSAGGAGIARGPKTELGATSARMAQARNLNAQSKAAAAQATQLGTLADRNRAEERSANSSADVNRQREESVGIENELSRKRLDWLNEHGAEFDSMMRGETTPANWPQLLQRVLQGVGITPESTGTFMKDTLKEPAAGKTDWLERVSPAYHLWRRWQRRKKEQKK